MASIDAVAKKYHPLIVGGLLLTVAYFQGRGIASLIAEQLHGGSVVRGSSPDDSLAKLKKGSGARAKNGTDILARNPFDSVTGPLAGKPPAASSAGPVQPKKEATPNDPPKCQAGEVTLIAGSTDPKYSFAVISAAGATKMRRIGDEVDGKKVESIRGESVVLATENGSERCKLTMHEEQKTSSGPGTPGVVKPTEGGEEPSAVAASPTRRMGAMSGIRKISETEYVIDEDAPQKLAQMKQAFMKSAKIVDGEGLRLYRAAQTTVLGHLGLKKGDLVKTLNGFDMSNLDQSTRAYEQLASATNVQVVVMRDGAPVTLNYKIEK